MLYSIKKIVHQHLQLLKTKLIAPWHAEDTILTTIMALEFLHGNAPNIKKYKDTLAKKKEKK